jgi:hypothetical protein
MARAVSAHSSVDRKATTADAPQNETWSNAAASSRPTDCPVHGACGIAKAATDSRYLRMSGWAPPGARI